MPQARIDDAVRRILRDEVRARAVRRSRSTDRSPDRPGRLRRAPRRSPARRSAQSLVLLKNDGRPAALEETARIHVAGKNADDIGNQCGGWTITWQGASGSDHGRHDDPAGHPRSAARRRDASATRATGPARPAPTSGVVVIGETPYAEGRGDRDGPLARSRDDVAGGPGRQERRACRPWWCSSPAAR